MPAPDNHLTLTFRCPKELDGLLPPPIPAAQGLPDWVRTMPAQAFNALVAGEDDTVKRCPPFLDAMTTGFLIPLICDVRVENGEFSWDCDLPPAGLVDFARSPLGVHDAGQVAGTPLFEDDRFLIKFHNLWTIEAPEGYALLFTHPVNRFDLPFTTLTGLVDCDRFTTPGSTSRRTGMTRTSAASCPGAPRSPRCSRSGARPGPRAPPSSPTKKLAPPRPCWATSAARRASIASASAPNPRQPAPPRRYRAAALGRRKTRPRGVAQSAASAGPSIAAPPCAAARKAASPAPRSPSSSRHLPRLIRVVGSSGRAASAWR
jgi:hypothetical protein